MAGQAIALAAVEGDFLPFGGGGLRAGGPPRRGDTDHQRQNKGWLH
jgi:hypothetical protein